MRYKGDGVVEDKYKPLDVNILSKKDSRIISSEEALKDVIPYDDYPDDIIESEVNNADIDEFIEKAKNKNGLK